MPTTAPEKFLTIKEASERLNLKPWWLHRAIAKKIIPAYKFATGRNLVRESEIVSVIESSRVEGAV